MYKGINEFKKGYQPRAYIIKKHDGTIVADTTNILSRWEQFFSNLLNANQSTSQEGSEVYTANPDNICVICEQVSFSIGCVGWKIIYAYEK